MYLGLIGFLIFLYYFLFNFYKKRFYRAAYKVVSAFMSKKTKEKVRVLGKEADLMMYFNKQSLILEYGGTSDPN